MSGYAARHDCSSATLPGPVLSCGKAARDQAIWTDARWLPSGQPVSAGRTQGAVACQLTQARLQALAKGPMAEWPIPTRLAAAALHNTSGERTNGRLSRSTGSRCWPSASSGQRGDRWALVLSVLTRARRMSYVALGGQASWVDGGNERGVVAFVPVGVRGRELGDRLVEYVRSAEVYPPRYAAMARSPEQACAQRRVPTLPTPTLRARSVPSNWSSRNRRSVSSVRRYLASRSASWAPKALRSVCQGSSSSIGTIGGGRR
jgi:hypothetical protein